MPSDALRILTIDDEDAVRRSIRAYLEDCDYEVFEAHNGREGLEMFASMHPDLVLCDLRMPDMDGLQVLASVAAQSPETPIIIVSGTGVIGDAIEAVRLEAWDYLLKPIHDMGALEHAINKALERARLRKENREYQIHLEQEVDRTQDLQESESRFRTVVECLTEGIVITDKNDTVSYLNTRMAKMCGYAVPELIGKPSSVMGAEHVKAPLHEKIRDRLQGVSETYETQLMRRNGEVFWVEISAGPYPTPEGRIIGSMSVVRDISERKRSDAERDKLEAQLRRSQKMETIGTLAGGVAHDFNNILTPILGYAEMAKFAIGKTHPVRSDIDQITQAAQRARDLVKQILTFSRQGKQEQQPVQVQLIIKEALKLIRSSLPSTIEIREEIKPDCPSVLCDPTQVHQILMNLCTNAFHAMRRQSNGVLEVKLDTIFADTEFACLHVNLREGKYVRLTITDTGHGMDKAMLERIFEPFFTTKEPGEGTGLGLSVVHGIVMSHGGGVSVYSEPGRGTTFQIYLPVTDIETVEPEDEELPYPEGVERILFVDDERANTMMGKQILSRLGYEVTRTNSMEALEVFKAAPDNYDLVITDQTMPQMTGDVLARSIHLLRPETPIILITGFSETVTARNFKDMGFSSYLMKPLLIRDLAVAVRDVLDNHADALCSPPDAGIEI